MTFIKDKIGLSRVASDPSFISDFITMFLVRYYLFLYIRIFKARPSG